MSFISAYFYDRLMKEAEEACLQRWRQELLEPADQTGDQPTSFRLNTINKDSMRKAIAIV